MMASLPKIEFNGCVFTPKNVSVDETLKIDLQVNKFILHVFKGIRSSENPQEFTLQKTSSVHNKLAFVEKNRFYSKGLIVLGLFDVVYAVYQLAVKKSTKEAVIFLGLAGTCATGWWYYNKNLRRINFDIANDFISMARQSNRLYNPRDYNI